MAKLNGQDCREGPNCPFPHTKEAFQEYLERVTRYRPGVEGWMPSKERRKTLVPTRQGQYGDLHLVTRPHVVNAVDDGQEKQQSEDEDDMMVERRVLGLMETDSDC